MRGVKASAGMVEELSIICNACLNFRSHLGPGDRAETVALDCFPRIKVVYMQHRVVGSQGCPNWGWRWEVYGGMPQQCLL